LKLKNKNLKKILNQPLLWLKICKLKWIKIKKTKIINVTKLLCQKTNNILNKHLHFRCSRWRVLIILNIRRITILTKFKKLKPNHIWSHKAIKISKLTCKFTNKSYRLKNSLKLLRNPKILPKTSIKNLK